MEQELLIRSGNMNAPAELSYGIHDAQFFVFCVVFYRTLLVLLFFFSFGHSIMCP